MSGSFNETKFAAFIANINLQHFGYEELLVGRYKADNGPPPERLWDNIVPTIVVLDALREEYQASIKLISVYRTEAYNDPTRHPGRAPTSTHQAFSAVDFQVEGVKPDTVRAKLREWECSKVFWSGYEFKRVDEKLSTGKVIKMGPMWKMRPAGAYWGVEFQFRGYVKSYGASFTHLDTRGLTNSSPGDTHHGEGADEWNA